MVLAGPLAVVGYGVGDSFGVECYGHGTTLAVSSKHCFRSKHCWRIPSAWSGNGPCGALAKASQSRYHETTLDMIDNDAQSVLPARENM